VIAVRPNLAVCAAVLTGLAGCGPSYSPNTYSSTAVQQAAKVQQGVVVGVRQVDVSADTTVGTVTGAAAGGLAGAQVGTGVTSAFAALGGTLLGGLAGSAAQHAEGDTKAYEYIVRGPNGDLVSVTQQDRTPLKIGEHVLVIAGKQARIVPDYTVPVESAKSEGASTPQPVAAPPVPTPPVPALAAVPPVPPAPSVPAATPPSAAPTALPVPNP
jgi:outer membrane lipoprotein SlyB